jgi:glucokinase
LSSPAVGVDLGGTNVRVGIVGPGGKILAAVRSRVADPAPERVVSLICDRIRVALGKASVELDDVAGVGIGAAAQLRGESGVVAVSPNLGWREVPFGGMLASALGRPVRVVNDVEAITWAEVSFGSARGHQNALGVFVGTGVGGGLVWDGRLIRGATGMAVEIGHVKVRNEGGEPCGCGGRGCIEAYLGGANLTRRLQREADLDWPALREKAPIHPGLIEELVADSDPRAIRLFRELSRDFGGVLAAAVTLLNPSALILGGTVMEGCPTLRRWSVEVMKARALGVAVEALSVVSGSLGSDAGVIGAATLVMPEDANKTSKSA